MSANGGLGSIVRWGGGDRYWVGGWVKHESYTYTVRRAANINSMKISVKSFK